ncbi:MAG: hypothetical protein R2712_11530 [Vicinamibacterales bacterium]
MRRLDGFVRAIERGLGPEADVERAIAHEQRISPELGGGRCSTVARPAPSSAPHRKGLF